MDANGLKVSKPGVDVLTASMADLLLDSNAQMLQVLDSGVFAGVPQNATRTVTLPDLGFVPLVYFYPASGFIRATFSGNTVEFFSETAGTWSVYWAIFNVPRG
ncbi:hypothetical protein DVH29_11250 [Pelagibacterium lacus]|uniref:Uncharacterized protein n=2 Tax=Pelagibacterium lacus TaxID=2282655 RepID=A0A369W314_9HYPH|nr:hypothetical protein DVH29_11250 [Pelagibacterium lacus]